MSLDLPTWNFSLIWALLYGFLGALLGLAAVALPTRWRTVPAVLALICACIPAGLGVDSVAATFGLAPRTSMPVDGWLRDLDRLTGAAHSVTLAKIHWAAHVLAREVLVLAAIPFALAVSALARSRRQWSRRMMVLWSLPAVPVALCLALLAAAVARPVVLGTPPPDDGYWKLRLAEESLDAPPFQTRAPMQTLEMRCRNFGAWMRDPSAARALEARVGASRVRAACEGCRTARLVQIIEAHLERGDVERGDAFMARSRLIDPFTGSPRPDACPTGE